LFPPHFRTELSIQKSEPRRVSTSTSLYLDFQFDGGSATDATRVLSAAIGAAPIASALLRSGPNANLESATARALIELAQKNGIAMLLASNAEEAAAFGADGLHLLWSPDIVRTFKATRQGAPALIIGADAGRSRHDAMELGEAGADYVAFGIPPHVEDRDKAAGRQRDLIVWWSDVFEIPCVAFDVPDADSARIMAAAGADFVSVGISSSFSEQDAAARVRAFSDALHVPEEAAESTE
jgi:thiamine-phosphate pyrophosphorylase